MLSYQPLRDILKYEGKTIHSLMHEMGFSTNASVALKNDLPVRLELLIEICLYLDVPIERVLIIRKP